MEDAQNFIESLLSDPGTADKLKSIVQSLGAGDKKPKDESPEFDAKTMQKLTRAMYLFKDSQGDERTRLLCDLKPYISGARQRRVDEAVNILRLIRVLDIMGDDTEDGE